MFGKVDTEAEQTLAGSAGITSIPTLMIFRAGILVFSQPGALPASALEEVIASARALDMDDIRAQIAQSKATAAASDPSTPHNRAERDSPPGGFEWIPASRSHKPAATSKPQG